MAAEVTAFGYAVPAVVVLAVAALVIVLAMATTCYLAVGWSVYRSVRSTRRAELRERLQPALFDRLFGPEPDWDAWVGELSTAERDVLESLLDEYLRELDGAEAERLRGLGEALGIPERAGRRLAHGDRYERLEALTWLALLRRPEPLFEAAYEPRRQHERAVAAYLLYETDRFDSVAAGVSLLVDGVDDQLSVFGQHTLYWISRRDPAPLLERAEADYREWPDPLLAQVLAVVAHLDAGVTGRDLSWLTAAMEMDNETIRAAAAEALSSFGWRASLRDQAFLERATGDPSPTVRAAVYEMLGAWGDDEALTVLMYALVSETHPRALTRGTTALVGRRDRIDPAAPAVLGDAWAWSSEHADYDHIARTATQQV